MYFCYLCLYFNMKNERMLHALIFCIREFILIVDESYGLYAYRFYYVIMTIVMQKDFN